MAPKRDRERRLRRIIRWLTALAIVLGLISTLSYSVSMLGMIVRYFNPPAGAWWDSHVFQFMEVSATALGLLLAIRCASRLVEEGQLRRRTRTAALIMSAIAFVPLSYVIAPLARFGWGADSASIRDFLQATASYGGGNVLDNIVIGGVYFLKSTAFAALAGFAAYAIVFVILMMFERPNAMSEESDATP